MKPHVPTIHLGKPPPPVSLTFPRLFLCKYRAWAGYMLHSCERFRLSCFSTMPGPKNSTGYMFQLRSLVPGRFTLENFPTPPPSSSGLWPVIWVPSPFTSSSAVSPWGTFLLRPVSHSTTDSPFHPPRSSRHVTPCTSSITPRTSTQSHRRSSTHGVTVYRPYSPTQRGIAPGVHNGAVTQLSRPPGV